MKSTAATVADYLAALPADRRAGIEVLRSVIHKNLDKGYEECMVWGVIGYVVSRRVFPHGHHTDPDKPLLMAGISNRKNDLTVYLMSVYGEGVEKSEREWFQNAWARAVEAGGGSGGGVKKLDMGGCCIHFKTPEDAALDVIGEAIRRTPAKAYVENYIKMLAGRGKGPDGKKLKGGKGAEGGKPAKKVVAKPVTKKVTKKVAKKTAKKASPKR